jgi:hypothetical protein
VLGIDPATGSKVRAGGQAPVKCGLPTTSSRVQAIRRGLGQESLDDRQQLLGLEWFLEERRACRGCTPVKEIVSRVSRDVEHREVGPAFAQPNTQRPSIQLRHEHVGDDQMQVGVGEGGYAPGFLAMPRLQGSIPGVAEYPGHHPANDVFILDDENDAGLWGRRMRLSQNSLRAGKGDSLNLKLHAPPCYRRWTDNPVSPVVLPAPLVDRHQARGDLATTI